MIDEWRRNALIMTYKNKRDIKKIVQITGD